MSGPFLLWPDPLLRAKAAPVGRVTEAHRAIWARMEREMYAMPGVGLAAPQIGVSLRLAVVDGDPAGRSAVRLADPEIVEASAETGEHPEASPNLPGVHARVTRPARVRVRYLDGAGEPTVRWFDGLWATSVQHQIDHLEGRLFIDRLGPVRRRILLDRYAKLRRRA